VVAHQLDELSIQLRGQWLNPGARLAICLRFAFVSQIAVEDNGIRAPAKTSDCKRGHPVTLPGCGVAALISQNAHGNVKGEDPR
jgi:hypothetical protein